MTEERRGRFSRRATAEFEVEEEEIVRDEIGSLGFMIGGSPFTRSVLQGLGMRTAAGLRANGSVGREEGGGCDVAKCGREQLEGLEQGVGQQGRGR